MTLVKIKIEIIKNDNRYREIKRCKNFFILFLSFDSLRILIVLVIHLNLEIKKQNKKEFSRRVKKGKNHKIENSVDSKSESQENKNR